MAKYSVITGNDWLLRSVLGKPKKWYETSYDTDSFCDAIDVFNKCCSYIVDDNYLIIVPIF